jgi:F0F1-type ATP synthase membrane subunit b/b'
MDTFLAVFTSLGVDSSLLIQIIIIAVAFFASKLLFLNQLQFILENREEKTIKLENNADENMNKVTKMMTDYKQSTDSAMKEAMKNFNDKKQVITKKMDDFFKTTEKEVNLQIETSREKIEKDISENQSKYLQEVDTLSEDLIKKIIH